MRIAISKTNRFKILSRDNYACQYCGNKAPDVVLEIDHKIPVSKGGTNDFDNLVTSCFDCNRGKSNKHVAVSKSYEERKINAVLYLAHDYFRQRNAKIKKTLFKKIISDLVYGYNLKMIEFFTLIHSCDEPQDFFELCLENYYHI